MHGSSLNKEKNIFHSLAEKTIKKLGDTTVPFVVIYIGHQQENKFSKLPNKTCQKNVKIRKFQKIVLQVFVYIHSM